MQETPETTTSTESEDDGSLPDIGVVYRRADGLWDWHLLSPNHEILYGSMQGYERKGDAIASMRRHHPNVPMQLKEA